MRLLLEQVTMDLSRQVILLVQEKTVENIRKLSPHDAEAYPKFLQFFDRASEILNPILLEEPPQCS